MRVIATKAKFFYHPEYGNRLIFSEGPTNSRDELGKIGVDIHTAFGSAFRNTVSAKVAVIDKNNNESFKTVFFNRLSLAKYLLGVAGFVNKFIANSKEAKSFYDIGRTNNPNYSDHDFFYDYIANDDDHLINSIDIAMLVVQENKTNRQYQQIYHAGNNNKKFSWKTDVADSFTGKFFSWLYQATIATLAKIKIRFAFANKEKEYVEISESMARLRYKEAKEAKTGVPAYREFLNGKPAPVKFSDIPATSKKNYILPSQSVFKDCDTHFKGNYPKHYKKDTSTGTTGKPTTWVRSHHEVDVIKKSMNVAREVEFGSRKLHYIDAFALGPWATGLTAYELMRETGNTFACGADMEKILDDLETTYQYEQRLLERAVDKLIIKHPKLQAQQKELIALINDVIGELLDDNNLTVSEVFKKLSNDDLFNHYKKSIIPVIEKLNANKEQYVLAGYPPFLKAVADEINKKDSFKKYHVRGVVGGQGISEAFRDSLLSAGFSHMNSSYGASDLDINVAAETEFEIKLRKAIEANPELGYDLFGPDKGAPMVFHYDPFNYHIESDQTDELYFTCVRNDRSSPRIRYDLGDKGRVYAASDIEAVLVKHGITDLKPRINLPFLFIWGRDSAVSFNGSKAGFDDLEHAVTKIDRDNRFLKRAFYKYSDSTGAERFDILIELNDKVSMPSKSEAHDILRKLIANMAVHNQDFRSHLGRNVTTPPLPRIRFFTRNESPISEPGGVRKQVLVFDKNNLPAGYDIDKKSHNSTFDIKKDEKFLAILETALAVSSSAAQGLFKDEVKGKDKDKAKISKKKDSIILDESSDEEKEKIGLKS